MANRQAMRIQIIEQAKQIEHYRNAFNDEAKICADREAENQRLKELLMSCFIEMVAEQWKFRDGLQGNIYKRVEQALAAQPQKGDR